MVFLHVIKSDSVPVPVQQKKNKNALHITAHCENDDDSLISSRASHLIIKPYIKKSEISKRKSANFVRFMIVYRYTIKRAAKKTLSWKIVGKLT